ncbi:MAG: hypothetical protein P1V97_13000 [Planctomycetota bacterium]|nr:hypothetical protein [Planctomycetota bacterium]
MTRLSLRHCSLTKIALLLLTISVTACTDPEPAPEKTPPKTIEGPKETAEIKAYIPGEPTELSKDQAATASAKTELLKDAFYSTGEAEIKDRLEHPRAKDAALNMAKEKLMALCLIEANRFLDELKTMPEYPENGPVDRFRNSQEKPLSSFIESLSKYTVIVARYKPVDLPDKTVLFMTVDPAQLFKILKLKVGPYLKGAGGRPYPSKVSKKYLGEFDQRAEARQSELITKQNSLAESCGFKTLDAEAKDK